jgi:formate-dependent nitrite reductase cytochrome c552 subunit
MHPIQIFLSQQLRAQTVVNYFPDAILKTLHFPWDCAQNLVLCARYIRMVTAKFAKHWFSFLIIKFAHPAVHVDNVF